MGKLERQQKKLEAMQAKEEKKRLKEEARQAKKLARKGKKLNIRPTRTERVDEGVEFKPKNTSWKKAVAVILWLIIAFFVVQGVVSVMTRETSDDLKKSMNKHYEALTDIEASQMEAGTFVASFIREFYTYDIENNTWNERVGKYVASGVNLAEPNQIDTETLISSEVRKISVNDKNIDVDIYAEVKYTASVTDGENTVEKEGTLKHIVRVPVIKQDDNYAIVGMPVYISDSNRAAMVEYNGFTLDGDPVSTEALKVLETTAGNFLKAYYGKKPSELKYYVTKDFGSLATVGGTMKFVRVEECQAINYHGGYIVKANAIINNGFIDVTETVFLEMVKGEENRVYVKEMRTRQK